MMESFVRRFIRASLLWLGVGVVIGLSMATWSAAIAYRPAHVHANLLGFVSMMIFGVAYHVMPRFTGSALYSRRLAHIHLWVANGGLALLVGGWVLRVHHGQLGSVLVQLGAAASAVGAFLFIWNLWRTLGSAAAPDPAAGPAARSSGAARAERPHAIPRPLETSSP